MLTIRARAVAALVLTLLCCLSAAAFAEDDGAMNLLLIGVDGYGSEAAGRSDAMLLVRVNPQTGDVRMASFMRDLYVSVPNCGKTRLNAAYYFGGESLLKKMLKNTFDVDVDRTVTVNFSTLTELIDELGGVELEVSQNELAPLNAILKGYNQRIGLGATHGLLESAGLQTLDGKQALSYSRIRKPDSDFKRTGRQQAVLSALLNKAKALGFMAQTRLVSQNLSKVRTDLSLADIGALLPLLLGGEWSMQTARVPFDGAFSEETVNGMQVLVPNLKANTSMLRTFLEGER